MTDSIQLIPDGPDQIITERQTCFVCGQGLAHYDMGHLHISARFERARRVGVDAREMQVAICPECYEAGTKFALNPLARTLRQNPMGRAAA